MMLTASVQNIIPNPLYMTLIKIFSSLLTELSSTFFGSCGPLFVVPLVRKMGFPQSFSILHHQAVPHESSERKKRGGQKEISLLSSAQMDLLFPVFWTENGFLLEFFLFVHATQFPDLAHPWVKDRR